MGNILLMEMVGTFNQKSLLTILIEILNKLKNIR